ncbi:AAA family ATPase [Reinekea marinisedimentorum]|uniref:AAA+ ATPase superfamily predicted ATPase n=1 Tax=Reinekea marinisedimentorum TaxID=230495 RepID=A0A4R3IC72_9GAMM|nr:AAA family ATPase [Reinekea marinisedimentorum]TCS43156.1 AAA+ ATPase superfamily predicted ATPase [Reinekea marinisedimentorum]
MANPFQYEKLPTADNFCGREVESERLHNLILDSKNVVLFGDRRYGKTSLIEHVFRGLPKTVLHAFADLFACTDSTEVAQALYKAVYDALPFDLDSKLKEISGLFKRATFEIQTTNSGSIKARPRLEGRDFEELLNDALSGAERFCEKHGCTLVIALDEFQQVAEIKDKRIDAILRAYMQRLTYISFIFSGSKKSILSGLFIDKKQPLYGMATSISIGGIELPTLKTFCEERLGQRFDDEVFELLYEQVRGQTKLILQSCYWLYANGWELNAPNTHKVVQQIIEEKDEEFRLLFNGFKAQQKKALKMIGRYGGKNLFKQENLEPFGLTRQGLSQVLVALIGSGDVIKEDKTYLVADVHFHLWIVKNFS